MHINNIFGKISAVTGLVAVVMSALAAWSRAWHTGKEPGLLLAPVINFFLSPLNRLHSWWFNQKPVSGPVARALNPFYMLEDQAIIVAFTLAAVLSMFAIYYCIRGIRNSENSIWYALGGIAAVYTLLIIHIGAGIVAAVLITGFVIRKREVIR